MFCENECSYHYTSWGVCTVHTDTIPIVKKWNLQANKPEIRKVVPFHYLLRYLMCKNAIVKLFHACKITFNLCQRSHFDTHMCMVGLIIATGSDDGEYTLWPRWLLWVWNLDGKTLLLNDCQRVNESMDQWICISIISIGMVAWSPRNNVHGIVSLSALKLSMLKGFFCCSIYFVVKITLDCGLVLNALTSSTVLRHWCIV